MDPDWEVRGRPVLSKERFCAFVVLGVFGRQRIQDWFYFRPKIRGGPRPPGPLPWIHNCAVMREFYPSQHVTWYLDWKWSSGWLEAWEGLLLMTDVSTTCGEANFIVKCLYWLWRWLPQSFLYSSFSIMFCQSNYVPIFQPMKGKTRSNLHLVHVIFFLCFEQVTVIDWNSH